MFVVPVTAAVNCCVCEVGSEAVEGVSEIVTSEGGGAVAGVRVTVALAVLVGSAALVAVTVTVSTLAIEAGAM